MFILRYFAKRFFPNRYFPGLAGSTPVAPTIVPLVTLRYEDRSSALAYGSRGTRIRPDDRDATVEYPSRATVRVRYAARSATVNL